MLLNEILDMVPQPFEWVDDERCIFELDGIKFGVILRFSKIDLEDNTSITAVNIAFGVYKNDFNSSKDLDLSLTKMEKPRKVLSTVAEACIANKKVVERDIICLASDDSIKNKRSVIYSLALSEIRSRVTEFKEAYDVVLKTKYGAVLVLLCKKKYTQDQELEITSGLQLTK